MDKRLRLAGWLLVGWLVVLVVVWLLWVSGVVPDHGSITPSPITHTQTHTRTHTPPTTPWDTPGVPITAVTSTKAIPSPTSFFTKTVKSSATPSQTATGTSTPEPTPTEAIPTLDKCLCLPYKPCLCHLWR